MRRWQDYVESLLVAVLIALVIRTFVISGYRVPTSSMLPTLQPGDFVFALRVPYGIRIPLTRTKLGSSVPQRGEVVVFTYPDLPRVNFVKRVIGLPGDLIEIIDGEVSVNGDIFRYEPAPDAVAPDPSLTGFSIIREVTAEGQYEIAMKDKGKNFAFGPFVVPQGEVFVIGDNREINQEAHRLGSIPVESVDGRVFMIWLSLRWGHGANAPQLRIDRAGTLIK